MLRRALAVAFIIGLLVVGSRGQDEVQRSREALAARTKQGSIRPILQVLDKANLSGSLEFSGRCDSFDVQDFPEFPKFHAPATSGGPPLQTLREMFADNPAMQVTQDKDGTIRMIEKGVPTDILNIWINRIPFGDGEAGDRDRPIYSAYIAQMRVLGTPEVESFMKAHKHEIEWPFPAYGALSGILCDMTLPDVPYVREHQQAIIPCKTQTDAPHISEPLYDVTFSEAMDYILKTFPGIWIYENCPRSHTKKRRVYFHFFYLQKLGTGEEYVQ